MLARELLEKPDGFLVVTDGNREFVAENIKKAFTQANNDDKTSYWALNIRECGSGNVKR